jgi:catechol 2,3-dioxygenase-like lactoylglutathione lyase family enzyme
MDVIFKSAVLFVRDVQASRKFYEGVLGQEVVMDHGPNIAFAGGFALWQADHAFSTVYDEDVPSGASMGARNLELYFETEALDDVWWSLEEAGTPVVHGVREQPWGQRVFRVHDPDGHVVEIGEPMLVVIMRFLGQGMSVEAAAARTSMPVEVVAQLRTMSQA